MSQNKSKRAETALTITIAAIATMTISSLYSLADKYGLNRGEVVQLFAEGLLKQADKEKET